MSHPGVARIVVFIERHFDVPSLKQKAQDYFLKFSFSLELKLRFFKPSFTPLIRPKQPWERLSLDFVGRKRKKTGNKFFLSVLDEFSSVRICRQRSQHNKQASYLLYRKRKKTGNKFFLSVLDEFSSVRICRQRSQHNKQASYLLYHFYFRSSVLLWQFKAIQEVCSKVRSSNTSWIVGMYANHFVQSSC